ncbi:MAG: voltage-gated chloride channel ClcB [Deltaproteobacteria bacterium]|nr:MAG: voltage-gated chloride channel ClcB [Deltaproteobacteria bacterium]
MKRPWSRPYSLVRLLRARLWLAALFGPGALQGMLLYAGLVGFVGGLGAFGFTRLINVFAHLLTGQSGDLVHTARGFDWQHRLLVPVLGSFAAGVVMTLGMRLAHGRSSPDFMEAIVLKDGIIAPRPVLVRCTSSLLSIASGGSMGREGPMVQLSAMLASWVGRLVRMPTPRRRLLVACGVAAGIASAYKAPIAGSLFVAEIVLGSIAMESFGPLVFAAVIATLTNRQLLHLTQLPESTPLYAFAGVSLHSNWETIPYILLGLCAGGLAPFFLRLLRLSSAFFQSLGLPTALRLAAGGVVVGTISIRHPEVWGNGQSVVTSLLHESWAYDALFITLICKLLATAATVGSGAVGGVFTPTLFVGATLGLLFEKCYHLLFPGLLLDPRAYALVGMGCFLAATTHAPLMAIIMLFEMTLDYDLVLPLMLGCVTAYYTAYGIDRRSIYTEQVEQKRAAQRNRMRAVCVADILETAPSAVFETAVFLEVAKIFARTQQNHLYVIDEARRLRGIISLTDIREYLNDPELAQLVYAYDIVNERFPVVTPEMSLPDAARQFTKVAGERLPVINSPTTRTLVGSISKTDLLLTLAHDGAAGD